MLPSERDSIAASAARGSLLAYAIGHTPSYRTPRHIQLLAAKLHAVEAGKIKRLMVFMPPRHGKSNLVSELFPGWYLGRKPHHQVMFTTYGQDLADGFGRKVRNAVADPKHTASFPGSVLAEDSQSAKRFNTTAGGVYYAVGAGGAVTGRGADCIVEGTLVNTAAGLVAIEDLQIGTSSGKILSLNLKESRLEYRELQAVASREADGIYRITTESGRVLEVTGNHRIFVDGQYRPASSVSPGESVVRLLQGRVCPSCLSGDEVHCQRAHGSLLQQGLLGVASRSEECEGVRGVRNTREVERSLPGCEVLRELPPSTAGKEDGTRTSAEGLPNLWGGILSQVARWGEVRRLLWQKVFGDRSFQADVGGLQPQVEGRSYTIAEAASFCQGVSGDASTDSGARRQPVRGVCKAGDTACSPHRQLADEQCCIEPCDALCGVSQQVACGEGWQAELDVVALVERVHAQARVYDIQVEENENFFAGGVLVHNCLIIDDPIKNREDADSRLIRDKLWDWYASTAYTRLMPGGAVVLVQTRWHEDDLAGRLLRGDEPWEVINLPAIAEHNDAMGRKFGDPLWPDQYNLPALENIRRTIGEREFTALYQQRPSALEGALFRRDWLRYKEAPRSGTKITMGVDLALSTKTSADYTAIAVIARDEFGKLYVLDVVRDRVDFPGALRLIRNMADKWKPREIAIEQVAFQAVVVQELLRNTTLPIRGVTPDKDKVTRAQSLALRYEQELVFHAQLPSWFEDELLSFPQSQHDDAVDALVYAYQSVMRMGSDYTEAIVNDFTPFDSEVGY